ncbi:MAG: hypothetical protein AAFR79_12990 [Pseudomonadota bacterium]
MSGLKGNSNGLGAFGRLIAQVLAARDSSVEIRRRLDLSDAALRRRGLEREGVVNQVFEMRLKSGLD